jgi:hypothetical protein
MTNAAPETIDWRNQANRVIDIQGPRILLSGEPALSHMALREKSDAASRAFYDNDAVPYRERYVALAVANIEWYIGSMLLTARGDNKPVAFRLGMDINNAVPGHALIAFEPYLLASSNGYHPGWEGTRQKDGSVQNKRNCIFRNLYAIDRTKRETAGKREDADHLDLTTIADIIDDITAQAAQNLRGTYDTANRMLVAYHDPKRGRLMLDGDYAPTRRDTGRAYGGAWDTEGWLPRP